MACDVYDIFAKHFYRSLTRGKYENLSNGFFEKLQMMFPTSSVRATIKVLLTSYIENILENTQQFSFSYNPRTKYSKKQ